MKKNGATRKKKKLVPQWINEPGFDVLPKLQPPSDARLSKDCVIMISTRKAVAVSKLVRTAVEA